MEKLKEPGTIISSTTAIGLVGAVVYFYKKIDSLESELNKTNEKLAGVIRLMERVSKAPEDIEQLTEAMKGHNDDKKQLKEDIGTIYDDIDDTKERLVEHLEALLNAMKASGVDVEDLDFDFEEEPKKKKKKKKSKSRSSKSKSKSRSNSRRSRNDSDSDDSQTDDDELASDLRSRRRR